MKPRPRHRQESEWLSSSVEKSLRITEDIKKGGANHNLGFSTGSVASRSPEKVSPTLYLALVWSILKYCVQCGTSQFRRHAEKHGRAEQMATKMATDIQPSRRG